MVLFHCKCPAASQPAPELPSWVQPQASAPPALPLAQLAGLASLGTGTGDSSSSAASCDVSPPPSAWLPNNSLPRPIPRPSPRSRSRSRRNMFRESSSSPVLYCLLFISPIIFINFTHLLGCLFLKKEMVICSSAGSIHPRMAQSPPFQALSSLCTPKPHPSS